MEQMLKIRDMDTILLINNAKEVLDKNWLQGYTSPSIKLYPHQWSWDSGFIAIGYSYFDEERAMREITSLLKGQWFDGMIPHIRYNSLFENYFPEVSFWNIPQRYISLNSMSSGITQPPMITIGAYCYWKNARDSDKAKDFLKEVFPGLMKFHRFLYEERNPLKNGLIAIVHPWESGMDNSLAWDLPLSRINKQDLNNLPGYKRKDTEIVSTEERPDDLNYNRYIYLIELFKSLDYEQRLIVKESPFLVCDILFNTILCRAGECLIEMGRFLKDDVRCVEERLDTTKKSIQKMLWDEKSGLYLNYDLNSRSLIKKPTSSSFTPLFAGIPDHGQAEKIYGYINGVCQCPLDDANFAVPSSIRCEDDFISDNYWKGPVWTNINWIIYKGLKRYNYTNNAEKVKESMLNLISRYGFYEYFDPVKKKGCGINDFSWTAALTIAFAFNVP